MTHLTAKYEADSNLRAPTFLEAQAADKQIHSVYPCCCNHVRNLSKAAAPIIQVKGPPKSPGKGKHELAKGKGKGKHKGPRVEWVTEINHGGQKKQLCMRYQTGGCQLGDSRRFHHACADPKDGKGWWVTFSQRSLRYTTLTIGGGNSFTHIAGR